MIDILVAKNKTSLLEGFKIKKIEFLVQSIICGLSLAALPILLAVLLKTMAILIAAPLLFFLGYRLPYLNLLARKHHSDTIKYYSFPKFVRNFINFSETKGNVYQTLDAILPYTDNPIKDEVVKLIKNLSERKAIADERRQAFLEFAHFIGTHEAILVMDTLANFDAEGANKEALKQLEDLIQDLQDNKTDEWIRLKVKAQEKYANYPIISGIAFTFFFAGVVFIHYLTVGFSQLSV
ncbi:hypothetical protein [Bacillus licheniformis]|uniref:hypothetical protein n=1 Tax=Bacillus licheniformis TaxID=1402 RepID=UPI000FFE0307|nr:hypothetical protein [Bacillus licheniformis]QAT55789.1 hypothetical protein EQY74_23255 [Bacillus licheniformis]